jgi:hypothetical protein
MRISSYGVFYKVHYYKAGQVITITNQDTNRTMLLNKSRIVSVEDVGSYRIITFMVTNDSSYKVYAKETVEEIKAIMESL